MKWWRILLGIVIVVVAGLAVLHMTKPDRKAHYDMVKGAILEVVSKELNENPALQPYATMGTMKALEVTDELLGRALIVHDHTYYNVGVIIYKDQLIPVSVGMLGRVRLTMNTDDLRSFIKGQKFMEIFGLKDIERQMDYLKTFKLPLR